MPKRNDPLNRVRIATPCPATWERMAGDDRVRHCTLCELNVYNFAAMTRDEVNELLVRTEGRVCARLYRRADGTVLTSDCPSGLSAVRHTLSRWSSATMAALLGVAALFSGCATARTSRLTLEVERNASPQQAVFTGVVVDETNNVLPGVTVSLRDEALQRELTVVTDGNGAFYLGSLADGLYRVEVLLPGFKSAVVKHVPLKQSEITRAHVTLRVTLMETITVGAIAVEAVNAPLSTTFTYPD
ncbi:MAG TPA: carboxypeptidase-like regulatory domain-containing protein [Thermoanaerobaculia bacterium]|nr:carboxypeptidase-like regulatory domain-containing protein [Thermoanaerobaculia bacterium]